MNEHNAVLKRRTFQSIRGWRALVLLGVLTLALATTAVSVAHVSAGGNGGATKWPAYYEDEVYTILMGPGDNSSSRNHLRVGCWGLGPDISGAAAPKGLNLFYAIFSSEADQMFCLNDDGTFVEGTVHDMILTKAPGDPGYNPKIHVMRCSAGPAGLNMPYTSAEAVETGIANGEIVCASGPIVFAQVIGGPGEPVE